MRTVLIRWAIGGLCAVASLAAVPAVHAARGLGVEVWTDRGNDGVYKPGDRMDVRVRVSDDAYLLVYEIDSEGYVHVLFPDAGGGFVEGRRTLDLPPERSGVELVVQEPTGEGFIVAVASMHPFADLPWYLRPYDPRAEDIGYEGEARDEEGVTGDGRIVGDPFVAMERIRRRLVRDYDNLETFASSYATYYVHHRVRYPRYVCYDCHRPGRWEWWAGFDPYYASCSVFTVRVNWGWYWGPSYWCGYVPYYVYVYRPDCPPRYKPTTGITYSAWNGWSKWNALWGGHLVRHKSDPPRGYKEPTAYKPDRGWRNDEGKLPPGFLTSDPGQGQRGGRLLPTGRLQQSPDAARGDGRSGRRVESGRPGNEGSGGTTPRREPGFERGRSEAPQRPTEGRQPGVERPARPERPERPERPAQEPPKGRVDPPQKESPKSAPRAEPARPDRDKPKGGEGGGRQGVRFR